MSTLATKLINRAKQACVAYYHLCTNVDDWGTMPEHWIQVEAESPATGYLNRYFLRVKDASLYPNDQRGQLSEVDRSPGVLCVTFLRGEITDTEWYVKPRNEHKHPEENYIHRDSLGPDPSGVPVNQSTVNEPLSTETCREMIATLMTGALNTLNILDRQGLNGFGNAKKWKRIRKQGNKNTGVERLFACPDVGDGYVAITETWVSDNEIKVSIDLAESDAVPMSIFRMIMRKAILAAAKPEPVHVPKPENWGEFA